MSGFLSHGVVVVLLIGVLAAAGDACAQTIWYVDDDVPADRGAGDHVAQQGGDTCASATEISSLPFYGSGTTTGYSDDYGDVCRTAPAPDVVYVYTPVVDLQVNIDTCGSSFDTVLYVFEGSCPGALEACNDDSCNLQSQLSDVTLTAGTTYYIVVDGYWSGAHGNYQIRMKGRPTCPYNSMFGQAPTGLGNWYGWATADRDAAPNSTLYDNVLLPVPNEVCAVRWWGFTLDEWDVPCYDTADTFEITLIGADNTPTVHSVTAERVNTGIRLEGPLYEFTAELPSCYGEPPVWIAIKGYGDASCWFFWIMSPDGDGFCWLDPLGYWDEDFAFCLLFADCDGDGVPDDTEPDSDDDGVIDDCDDCPGTASGDPVDADGCSTADDDDDGVLNDQDECPDTPGCADVDSDGCPSDSDGDGVVDGCDECADTPSCATNIDADGCAIDSDGDGSPDGCPPAAQGCCGAGGPVAPLGLAIGMLLMSRYGGYRRARRRC